MQPRDTDIHLSLVATSRNDNHGGYLTRRMQHFVNGFVEQCKRHNLRAELIVVEWNPPADRQPLADELGWPEDCGPCDIRIVTVPRELHSQIPHGDKLPLFQMIAKNVGIRRARGRFVLATNIDILFSDEVMRLMRDKLQEGHLYRADRYDVPTELPAEVNFDLVLDFCKREAFRIHATGFTLVKRKGKWYPRSSLHGALLILLKGGLGMIRGLGRKLTNLGPSIARLPVRIWRNASYRLSRYFTLLPHGENRSLVPTTDIVQSFKQYTAFVVLKIRQVVWLLRWIYQALIKRELFTNACGDFTLLSRADWFALRGYPEWPMYSWHLDSILLYQGHRSGIREIYLGKTAGVFHIEHAPGSGFTPESSDKLFERLTARGIPYLDWHRDVEPMIAEMDRQPAAGRIISYNDQNWGYAEQDFSDVRVDRRPGADNSTGRPVSYEASA